MRDRDGELTRTVGDVMRQNPIPVLLTAASLAWVIASSIRSRQPYVYGHADAGAQPPEEGQVRTLQEDEPGVSEKVGEKLQSGADAARRTWRGSRAAASGRVSQAMSATRARAQQAQQRAQSMMDEQPLVLAALAAAAGVAIGAALPRSQIENRTVGSVRDRTLAKAKEAGERGYENLRGKLRPSEDPQVSGRVN
jgi:ElaB/YqjD/DUF883 family membrane-anchored ribosome-binding protein